MNELFLKSIVVNEENVKDSYIRDIPAFADFHSLNFDSPICFFTGENGSGKSTLLEMIAACYGLNREGGNRNYNFSTYEEDDFSSSLILYRSYLRSSFSYFFRAETFFNTATMEEEYVLHSKHYHQMSHGESFLTLFTDLSNKKGLYLLDEPEEALSPQRQFSFFCLMDEFIKNGSQMIIATHSPILLSFPNADIYDFSEQGIQKTEYANTQAYQIYQMFLKDPQHMAELLLKKSGD